MGDRTFNVQARAAGSGIDQFDVAFFTASCDTAEANAKYAAALKLDYPILSDPDQEAAKAYGVVDAGRPFPQRWTFFIDPDRTILHIDKDVRTGSHGADIAAKLNELGVAAKE